MCAQAPASTRPSSEQSRFYRRPSGSSSGSSTSTARRSRWCCEHQPLTLVVAVATLLLTVLLYVVIPKGFFPVQDTGVILGISEAPQSDVLRGHGRPAAGAGDGDPEGSGRREPVVLHRHRRHEHDAQQRAHPDQPEAARRAQDPTRATSSAGCSRRWRKVAGITLYMQPVQDLTVEDRVSRTQFQYSLEDPDSARAGGLGRRSFVERAPDAARAARRRERPAEPGPAGTTLVIDRDTASRLGITPQMIDDTLYDAFGQRQVSTMFTQLNQYRVVLEVEPELPESGPDDLDHDVYVDVRPTRRRDGVRSARSPASRSPRRRSRSTTRGSSRWSRSPSTSRPGASLGDAVERDRAGARRRSACRASIQAGFQGTAQRLPGLARERAAADPRRARHGLHRARRALRELHPPDHDPLDAAVGGRRRAARR